MGQFLCTELCSLQGVCLEEMDKQVNQTSGGGGSASHGFSEQQIADALRGALEQGVRYAVELASEVHHPNS